MEAIGEKLLCYLCGRNVVWARTVDHDMSVPLQAIQKPKCIGCIEHERAGDYFGELSSSDDACINNQSLEVASSKPTSSGMLKGSMSMERRSKDFFERV